MFGDAAKEGTDPKQGLGGGVDEGEKRLAFEQSHELAQLRASELKEEHGGWRRPEALQGGERRQDFGRRGLAQVDLDFERDGIAGRSQGEIRREEKPEHERKAVTEGTGRGSADRTE